MTNSNSKTKKHIHKLKRHRFGSGNTIYFCTLPDCSYKIKQPLALGKESICNRCGNAFIMNEYSIRLAKPHCTDCHKSKDSIIFNNGSTIAVEADKEDILSGELTIFDKMKKASSGVVTHAPLESDEDEI